MGFRHLLEVGSRDLAMEVCSLAYFILAFVQWTQVEGSPMDLKDPVLERYVTTFLDMGELAMRNIKTWKIDFDEQMEVYIRDYDDKKCTMRQELDSELKGIEKQIERVSNGHDDQIEQLTQIINLVKDTSFSKNGTILAGHQRLNDLLQSMLEKTREGKQEIEREKTVDKRKRNEFETQDCPCLHSEWTPWNQCSVFCGRGFQSRTRTVEKPALNHGTCEEENGDLREDRGCMMRPCPVHCRWDRWSAWGQCKQVCPDGSRTRTRAKSQIAQYGGRECDEDSEELTSCNRLSELENELAQLREEIRLLEEQLGCDVTRCKVTPYRTCGDGPMCGTKNGISCSYIPQGLGNTGCAEDPEPTLTGKADNWLTMYTKERSWDQLHGVDISGGCSALLRFSFRDVKYSEVLQPGFTALKKTEFLGDNNPDEWVGKEIGLWFADQIKLFCPKK